MDDSAITYDDIREWEAKSSEEETKVVPKNFYEKR